jgi:hypothetical protein
MRSIRRISLLLFIGIVGILLTACNAGRPVSVPSPSPEIAVTVASTNTPEPTQTSTPVTPLMILLAPDGADPALVDDLQKLLTDFSTQAGLRFQVRPELAPSDLGDEVKIVVAVPPDSGIAKLAASARDTQFLAVMMTGVEPDTNLSIINSQAERPDLLGFTAGYLGAVVTEDWRVGVISSQDTPAGNAASLSVANGMIYFCGLCRPVYPPFPTSGYPLSVQLLPGATQADRQSAVDYFKIWQVNTVYVAPEVAESGLLNALAEAGINMIGVGEAPAGVESNWVASLGSADPLAAVQEILPSLLEGQQGKLVELPIVIENANPDLFSPGRQSLVDKMLADLTSGYIDTGVDPATGESTWTE